MGVYMIFRKFFISFIHAGTHTNKHIHADTKVKFPKFNYFMYEANIKLYFSAENKPENSDSEDSGYGK